MFSFLLAALIASSGAAWPQAYPAQPIKLVVPIAPGSVTDVILRAVAQRLAPRLGQQVVIENRAGGNFVIGAQACASAAPDGYTLCAVNNNSLSINPLIYDKLPYDADKDFVPVTNLYIVIETLAASASLEAKTVAELRELARAKPASLNFGTLGQGSYPDLYLAWLNNRWGSKIVGVPYRGGGPVAQALASGEIQLANIGLGNILGLLPTGKIRLLTVSTEQRLPSVPEVPTAREAGLGDFPDHVWWGLVAPRGTPAPIIDKLNREFVRLFQEPEFVAYLAGQAAVAAVGSPAEFTSFLMKDRSDTAALLSLANTPRLEYRD